ncbi:hypothetical protein P4S64_06840 [Vibrio sp. M60_M31a]
MTVLAQVSLLVVVLTYKPDVTLVFALNIVCTFIQFLLLHVFINFPFSLPNKQRFIRYIRYSAPLMLSGVAAFGLSGAEKVADRGSNRFRNLRHVRDCG